MTKLSKKDQTPESIAAEAAATLTLGNKRSKHFEVGTFVIHEGDRGEIIDRFTTEGETLLTVRFDDGTVGLIKPIALNR